MFYHAKIIALLVALVLYGYTPASRADIVEYFPNGDFEVGNFDLEIMRSPRYGVPPVKAPSLEGSNSIAGKSSLYLSSISKGNYRLVTRAVDLLPDQQYHFSLAVGIEQQGMVLVEVFGSDGFSGKKVADERKTIANGNGKISLSFNTVREFTQYWFRLSLSGDGDFILDDLSLKGPSSNNQVPEIFGLWLFSEKPLGVFKLNENGAMGVHIRPGTETEITYEITDGLSGEKIMPSKSVPVGIDGKTKLPLITGKRGYFMVKAEIASMGSEGKFMMQKPYAVIQGAAAGVTGDRRFGLCMEEHGLRTYIDAHYSAEDLYTLAHDMAAGSVRLFSLAKPEMLSSDGITFNYTELDAALALAAQYDLQAMIPLGSNSPHNVPDWLREAEPGGNVDLVSNLKTEKLRELVKENSKNYLNIKKYELFLVTLLSHLRDKVNFFEVWNEPGHKFSVEDTIKLTTAANRAKSKVYPEAVLLGPSSTKGGGTGQGQDPESNPTFLNDFIAGGGGQHIDILSFHSEHAFRFMGDEFDLRNQETGYVLRIRRVLKKYGESGMGVWDTERGMPWRSRYSDRANSSFAVSDIDVMVSQDQSEVARQLPMIFAADISNDVKRTFWFYLDSGNPSIQVPDYTRRMFDLYNEPTQMIPVYAGMTEKLAGALYHSKADSQNGTRVYLFSHEGDTIILAYNWQEKNTTISIEVGGGDCAIFDVMGNQEGVCNSGESIPVSKWPQYIVINNTKPEQITLMLGGIVEAPVDFYMKN